MSKNMSDELAEAIRGVGGSILPDRFSAISEVFCIAQDPVDGKYKFQKSEKPRGARCDPHRHTYYSCAVLGSGTTNLLGVKESYAHPYKLIARTVNDGMDIHTIQDHNDVRSDGDRREYEAKHPEIEYKTFQSCEYDVRVPGNKTVHVGVWGLDYPGQTRHRITHKEVKGLHYKLNRARNRNVEHFRRVCDDEGLIAVLNHPPWMSTPKRPLSGEDLSHICDVFDYLEINGDSQRENLFTVELAAEKKKILVAGSDLHNLRSSTVFTETVEPAEYAWEFLQQVRDGKVTIGTTRRLSGSLDTPFDVLRAHFNGTRMDMYNDIYRGIGNYLLKDNKNWKKWTMVGTLGALSVGGAYVSPWLLLPVAFAVGWLAFTFPIKYGFSEKAAISERTISLYNDYQDFRLRTKLAELKEKLGDSDEFFLKRDALEKIVDDNKEQFEKARFGNMRRPWEWVAQKFMPVKLQPDYDFSDRLEEPDDEEQLVLADIGQYAEAEEEPESGKEEPEVGREEQ